MRQEIIILSVLALFWGCTSGETKESDSGTKSEYVQEAENEEGEIIDGENLTDEELQIEENGCPFQDDTYSAEVDYFNTNRGYSNNYTLDVNVEDCQVVQINFPNDGYLDDSHISAADLDEDGNASITDDQGRTFEIHIEL